MQTSLENLDVEPIQESYGRCIANGDMLDTFYNIFLNSNPAIKIKFEKTDFDKQKKLLKHGINLMIMFSAGNFAGKSGLKRIRQSHSKYNLDISPNLYDVWKRSLLEAISKHDLKYDMKIKKQWEEVLDIGINYIKQGYDE